jgi:RimJ/RimL family protein N-acetyltransferase
MSLFSVYELPNRHDLLFRLLGERDETVNISHKALPSFEDHVAFVESRPYTVWYFICDADEYVVGTCYLSKQDEIGVQVFRHSHGLGYGKSAVRELMKLHGPRRYLANINPQNERSAKMFKDLGFGLIQHTYEAIA